VHQFNLRGLQNPRLFPLYLLTYHCYFIVCCIPFYCTCYNNACIEKREKKESTLGNFSCSDQVPFCVAFCWMYTHSLRIYIFIQARNIYIHKIMSMSNNKKTADETQLSFCYFIFIGIKFTLLFL
jgi:hypothetical protein